MNPKKTHVMLDLETVGVSSQAAIVAIGACKFSLEGGVGSSEDHFSAKVDLDSCIDAGLKVDGSTISWWMRQSEEARQAAFPRMGALHLAVALRLLMIWLPDRCHVYTCGLDYDFAILNNALDACGMTKIEYWRSRCFRTAREYLADEAGVKPPSRVAKHEALQDAIAQAWVLFELYNYSRPKMLATPRGHHH